jgi:hypothetical protein
MLSVKYREKDINGGGRGSADLQHERSVGSVESLRD